MFQDPELDDSADSTRHQICVLTASGRELEEDEQSEAFDSLGNPYVDPADLTKGTRNKYARAQPREQVQLSQGAWDRAARAINGTEPMTTQATAEELTAYQYKLSRTRRELQKMQEKLDARKVAVDASSERRANLSAQSGNSANNGREPRGRARSRMAGIPEDQRGEYLIQDLDMSFMSIDSRGHITPKTPEAAYMATHAYMMATRPPPGDPRASLYQTAMAGIGVMGAAIASREVIQEPARSPRRNSPRQGGHRRSRSPHRQRSPRQAAAATRNIQREGDARNNTAQA